MLKLLSFQPLSLYKNGGASRVLRRLYNGREQQVYAISVTENTGKLLKGTIAETVIAATPLHRQWMRWKVRNLFIWLREQVFRGVTFKKIIITAKGIDFDVLHVVHHGPFCMALIKNELLDDKQLWVSFHDHFNKAGVTHADTQLLWNRAHRRLMISTQLAEEYQRLFGLKPYELMTDGVFANELSAPRDIDEAGPVIIYFSGLLHNEYYPLFEVLANAMDELSSIGIKFKLILRGTQQLSFLNNRAFETIYRTDFISDEAIKAEMDMASILYLPIKFNDPEFYLYSLSTKMVGYLGSPGAVLYHGPADSAACNRLRGASAAVNCTTLVPADMVNALKALIENAEKVSANAKLLAKDQFEMTALQEKFWEPKTA